MAAAFMGSNTFGIAFVFGVLVSFSVIHQTHSYIIPRHSLTSYNINDVTLNTKYARRRICKGGNDNKIDASTRTRLKLSYQQQPPQDDTNSNTSSSYNSKGTSIVTGSKEEKEPTLYELLEAPRTATRSELKKQYIKLARVSHPDAQIGGTGTNDVDFQKITEAWRTLGHDKSRKRYDRELKAKEWGEKAQRFTNEGLEQVAPVASKIMDQVAVPFLRRTSATIAFGKNIANGFRTSSPVETSSPPVVRPPPTPSSKIENNDAAANQPNADQNVPITNSGEEIRTDNKPIEAYGSQEINSVVGAIPAPEQKNGSDTTIRTATNTNYDLDTLVATTIEAANRSIAETPNELNDESMKLEEQARAEEEKGRNIFEELDSIKKQRLFATLQSSDFTLTSYEAEEILEKLIGEDVNRGMKKTAIEKEIQSLRNTENQFTESLQRYNKIDDKWHIWLTRQEVAKMNLTEKKKNEIEARKAFDNAKQMLDEAKKDVVFVSNTLNGVEQEVRKGAEEMDRVSTTLSKKQGRVQKALRRKTEWMKGGIQVEYITEKEVVSLRSKETQLMGESKEIATMVGQLQSRADKLKKRAKALERLRNS